VGVGWGEEVGQVVLVLVVFVLGGVGEVGGVVVGGGGSHGFVGDGDWGWGLGCLEGRKEGGRVVVWEDGEIGGEVGGVGRGVLSGCGGTG